MASNKIIRGKRLLRNNSEWVDNGAIAVSGEGIILAIDTFDAIRSNHDGDIVEFADATLIPALHNAHTHLEMSYLQGKIPPPARFTDWLKKMALHLATFDEAKATAAAEKAVRDMLSHGIVSIADILTYDLSVPILANFSTTRKWYFLEVAGINQPQTSKALSRLDKRIRDIEPTIDTYSHYGISPHATYSATEQLIRECVALRDKESCLMSIHLAESPEEEEFVRHGTGSFREFFEYFGLLPHNWRPPGCSPVEYAHSLDILGKNTLAVHCNYLSSTDIELLASTQTPVVMCPGSHRYFGNYPHPLPRLLDAGVTVCLGTDSLASNESLDLFREMRIVAESFPELAAGTIFKTTTEHAARALGVGEHTGKLAQGLSCDVIALNPERGEPDPTLEGITGKEDQSFSVTGTIAGNIVDPYRIP